MEIGWIDFSKEERNKVLSVIDLLSEPGAVDELGIGVIRDGFSGIFSPGVSTIQTRAKYLLIVPYILSELERTKGISERTMLERLDARERECAEKLLETCDDGVIGQRSLRAGRWVKRAPSSIYWNGLRTYGIFNYKRMSLAEYARVSCLMKTQKQSIKDLGNSRDTGDENDADDQTVGMGGTPISFWTLPDEVNGQWQENLTIELSRNEALFLKRQIIKNCGKTLLGFVLANNRRDFLQAESFDDLGEMMAASLPDDIVSDIRMAKEFADFIFGAHIRYNVLLSNGEDEDVQNLWAWFASEMTSVADIDIDRIFLRLHIFNPRLNQFLRRLKENMLQGNVSGLDALLVNRELELKGKSRSKLANAHEFRYQAWVGISKLQYLLPNTQRIIEDIFAGVGEENA